MEDDMLNAMAQNSQTFLSNHQSQPLSVLQNNQLVQNQKPRGGKSQMMADPKRLYREGDGPDPKQVQGRLNTEKIEPSGNQFVAKRNSQNI